MARITEYCMPERADDLKTFYVVLDSSRVDSICSFFRNKANECALILLERLPAVCTILRT